MIRPSLALSVALSMLPITAGASPLLGSHTLPQSAERILDAAVRAERAAHPEHFAAVGDLRGLRRNHYMSTRLRRPSVARELAALGRDALLPMLELLALRDYPRALDAEERAILEVALLEAVAALRDRRAAPVLRLALETRDDPDVLRAAARGLGALAGNDDVSLLIAMSQRTGPRALAALEGLGAARRDDATQALIDVLGRSSDVAVINAAAHGLSEAGTSWGSSAATTLPARCSAALLRALLRAPEAARRELQVAIVAVAAPDTLAQLAAARTQIHDPVLRARLVSLERMVRRQLAAR